MEVVKKTADHTIIKKRNGRYGVMDAKGRWINKDEKVKILLGQGFITAPAPKPSEPVQEEAAPEVPEAAPEAEAQEEKTEE